MRRRPDQRPAARPAGAAAVRGAAWLAGALAAGLLLPAAARADSRIGPLRATLTLDAGRLTAAVDLAPAFDPALERRLGNGLTNVVAVLLLLVPEQGGQPLPAAARVTEVLFDVWDEDYTLTIHDSRLPAPRRRAARDFAALRRLLADAGPLDLGPPSQLPPGGFRLEARIELNPVSRELMQRTREQLANPTAGGRPGAGARSVLGAVAGYLLRDPGPGDDLVVLRSGRLSPTGAVVP